MARDVSVALLKSAVFFHIVQVVSSDDNRPVHLGGNNFSFQYTSTNRDLSSERAFLVNVRSLQNIHRGLMNQNPTKPSPQVTRNLPMQTLAS